MSILKSIFLESPIWLAVFSFLLFAVVLFARRRMEPPMSRYSLPAVLALIALLFAIQKLVVTDREAIRRTLQEFAIDVESKDYDRIQATISPQYLHDGLDREAFIASTRSFLDSITIRDVRIGRCDIVVDGDSAMMDLSARATVSVRSEVGQFHTAAWKIDWTRFGDDWKVTGIQPVAIDGVDIGGLRQLRQMAP